eukprot:CAMPEP_0201573276 /NCGR_PEP_ID=MMETSP0190_2-20130828/17021_1 /ASSEMBLY_ACC=CAM_ASM_000263 /TAXON_ID=37353 /ORGANISM="Rosalina sp." /LENGTH=207 /DNA_ID=CAMNT_0048000023 /DNA_START=42 /DNA_END=665 /DNA_ORIENTATION=+
MSLIRRLSIYSTRILRVGKYRRNQVRYFATAHDNIVKFTSKTGPITFKYSPTNSPADGKDHIKTSGQPFEGVTSNNNSVPQSDGSIDVIAGRKGDKDNAKWFKTNLQDGVALYSTSNNDPSVPDKLNFAIYGKLIFGLSGVEYTLNDVVIGQGHFSTTNNWWIGGKDFQEFEDGIRKQDGNGVFVFERKENGGKSNEFYVTINTLDN